MIGDWFMSAGVEGIDHTVDRANISTKELDKWLGWDNRQRTRPVLCVVLQVLRDWVPINDGANRSEVQLDGS
jgi:hypothetical protein